MGRRFFFNHNKIRPQQRKYYRNCIGVSVPWCSFRETVNIFKPFIRQESQYFNILLEGLDEHEAKECFFLDECPFESMTNQIEQNFTLLEDEAKTTNAVRRLEMSMTQLANLLNECSLEFRMSNDKDMKTGSPSSAVPLQEPEVAHWYVEGARVFLHLLNHDTLRREVDSNIEFAAPNISEINFFPESFRVLCTKNVLATFTFSQTLEELSFDPNDIPEICNWLPEVSGVLYDHQYGVYSYNGPNFKHFQPPPFCSQPFIPLNNFTCIAEKITSKLFPCSNGDFFEGYADAVVYSLLVSALLNKERIIKFERIEVGQNEENSQTNDWITGQDIIVANFEPNGAEYFLKTKVPKIKGFTWKKKELAFQVTVMLPETRDDASKTMYKKFQVKTLGFFEAFRQALIVALFVQYYSSKPNRVLLYSVLESFDFPIQGRKKENLKKKSPRCLHEDFDGINSFQFPWSHSESPNSILSTPAPGCIKNDARLIKSLVPQSQKDGIRETAV
eukprot:GHVP01053086.1.p1 GENE.GHVP01053086.1~~GHVP01053086.1.p1  ORF type:complete len:503 (+),score=79.42 GHVP01053086.1:37-1545(+)